MVLSCLRAIFLCKNTTYSKIHRRLLLVMLTLAATDMLACVDPWVTAAASTPVLPRPRGQISKWKLGRKSALRRGKSPRKHHDDDDDDVRDLGKCERDDGDPCVFGWVGKWSLAVNRAKKPTKDGQKRRFTHPKLSAVDFGRCWRTNTRTPLAPNRFSGHPRSPFLSRVFYGPRLASSENIRYL
jgi:hypothetical protein